MGVIPSALLRPSAGMRARHVARLRQTEEGGATGHQRGSGGNIRERRAFESDVGDEIFPNPGPVDP